MSRPSGGGMSRPSPARPGRSPSMGGSGAARPAPRPSPRALGASRPSTGVNPGISRPGTGNVAGTRPSTGPRPGGAGPGVSGRPNAGQLNDFLDVPRPSTGAIGGSGAGRPGGAAGDFLQQGLGGASTLPANRPGVGGPGVAGPGVGRPGVGAPGVGAPGLANQGSVAVLSSVPRAWADLEWVRRALVDQVSASEEQHWRIISRHEFRIGKNCKAIAKNAAMKFAIKSPKIIRGSTSGAITPTGPVGGSMPLIAGRPGRHSPVGSATAGLTPSLTPMVKMSITIKDKSITATNRSRRQRIRATSRGDRRQRDGHETRIQRLDAPGCLCADPGWASLGRRTNVVSATCD